MTLLKSISPFLNKAALFLLLAAGFAVDPAPVRATIIDGVAAKINEEIITISAVTERTEEIVRAKRISSLEEINKLKKTVLDKMIEDKLLLVKAKELNVTAEEKDVETALEDIRKKNNFTEEKMKEMLEQQGMTLDNFREDIRERIIISKVTGMEISSQLNILEKDVKEYYQNHADEFAKPEEIKASHILFAFKKDVSEESAEKKAREVHARLKKGENFSSMARLYSDDATSAEGGDLGYFTRGVMVSSFEEAAFRLKIGEIGAPIKTQFGYHIIMVTDRTESQPTSFADARPKIEEKLREKLWNEKFKTLMDTLRTKNFVEILMDLPDDQSKDAGKPEKTEKRERREKESAGKKAEKEEGAEELIKSILLAWKEAIEGGDLKKFAACYSSAFESGRKDKDQWVREQKDMNETHKRIRLTLRDLRVTHKNNLYVATLGQEFTSSQEHKIYERRFYLRLEEGQMKIVGEKWIARDPDFDDFSKKPPFTSKSIIHIINSSS